jgi:O-acetyl-ADP-ribose deacetylase (regulator of RNase III)
MKRIELIRGDITKLAVDAIVNAAEIAITAVTTWFLNHKDIKKVYFALYDEENFNIYHEILKG